LIDQENEDATNYRPVFLAITDSIGSAINRRNAAGNIERRELSSRPPELDRSVEGD
jgi:hypothetical protein